MRKVFKARKLECLVVRELGDEVVIYDTEDDRCHVLNSAAAIAWKHCGEDAAIGDLAAAIAAGTDLPADPEVAYLALEELKAAGLLEAATSIPQRSGGVSRRQMLLGMGGLAAALPAVTSLLAPSPAMAASRRGPISRYPRPERRPISREPRPPRGGSTRGHR